MKQENKTTLEILLILNFFILIFLFGLFLNKIVMINNEGRMPVYEYRNVTETEIHYGYSDKNEINLWFLSDIFFAEKDMFIHPKGSIFSIGDCFLWIGYFGSWLTLLFFIFYVFKLMVLWELK